MNTTRREFLATTAASLPLTSTWLSAEGDKPRTPIKVGQIGVGHAHANKLEVYRESPDYDVVGIVEPDDALRERAASQNPYRDLPWMTREQLLNVDDLDVVLVETHVEDLLDNAEVCIAAGKHVHLDKPAGQSLQQYERILASGEQQNLLVQMGYMYRYNPAVLLLKEFLANGWLGDVFEVHTVMSKVVPEQSRKGLAEFPGGIMFELGCHILDLVIGVLGQPTATTSVRQHVSPLDDGLLDNMLAVLTYPKAIATVKSSAVEVEGFARRHFVVCGTEGTFHIQPLDAPSAEIALSQDRGEYKRRYQTVTFPKYRRYVGDAADMAKIIRGEKPCDYAYSHDLTVQRTLLQACGLPLT